MQTLIFRKAFTGGIIIAFLLLLTNIEYDNFKLSLIVYPLLWISIPLILRYILVKESINKTVYVIGVLGYLFMTFFYLLVSIFCAWSKDLPLYKNKKNKSLLIVCRTYDCYGTAENCRLYQVKMLTAHIKWVSKFDENKVDSSKWQEIPFNPEIYNP